MIFTFFICKKYICCNSKNGLKIIILYQLIICHNQKYKCNLNSVLIHYTNFLFKFINFCFQTADAGEDLIDQIKLPLVTLPLIVNIISFVMVAIGSFLVLTAFVLSMLYALGKVRIPEYILLIFCIAYDRRS